MATEHARTAKESSAALESSAQSKDRENAKLWEQVAASIFLYDCSCNTTLQFWQLNPCQLDCQSWQPFILYRLEKVVQLSHHKQLHGFQMESHFVQGCSTILTAFHLVYDPRLQPGPPMADTGNCIAAGDSGCRGLSGSHFRKGCPYQAADR